MPLKLTSIGAFLRAYTVRNTTHFWEGVFKEVQRSADAGEEWEAMLDERIQGMQELKASYYELCDEFKPARKSAKKRAQKNTDTTEDTTT